jgi:hypothetical protein
MGTRTTAIILILPRPACVFGRRAKAAVACKAGTSFASPFITAAVALNLSNGVKPDSRTLRKTLRRFTKDLDPPGRDAIFGWGLVRIRPKC